MADESKAPTPPAPPTPGPPGGDGASNKTPTWVLVLGLAFACLAVLFLLVLLVLSFLGHPVPRDSRFFVSAIFSLLCAVAFGFLGGYATAEGTLPVLAVAKEHALRFGVTGAVAVFVIVLVLCHWLYV